MENPLEAEAEPEAAQDWTVMSHFRHLVMKLSLMMMVVMALLALSLGKAAAQGVMLGGTAAILGFEIAVRTFRLEKRPGDKVKLRPSIWWTVRFLAYVAALVKGYNLDTTQYCGLFGAIAGLLIVRVVVTVVGVTGLDLKKVP